MNTILSLAEKNRKQLHGRKKLFYLVGSSCFFLFFLAAAFSMTQKKEDISCLVIWKEKQHKLRLQLGSFALPFFVPSKKWNEAKVNIDSLYWTKSYYLNEFPRSIQTKKHQIIISFENTISMESETQLNDMAHKILNESATKNEMEAFVSIFHDVYKNARTHQTVINIEIVDFE